MEPIFELSVEPFLSKTPRRYSFNQQNDAGTSTVTSDQMFGGLGNVASSRRYQVSNEGLYWNVCCF